MRAAVMDNRLEAIAGPPRVYTREPWNQMGGESLTGTIIAVGQYVHHPDEHATGQALLQLRDYELETGERYLYVSPENTLWDGRAQGQRGTLGENIFFAWLWGENSKNAGIGRHQSSNSYHWHGPMAGAAYDRTLTPSEIRHVLTCLSLSLSLSLRLTPTPSPLTPATSRIGAWQHESGTCRPAESVSSSAGQQLRVHLGSRRRRKPCMADSKPPGSTRDIPSATASGQRPISDRRNQHPSHYGHGGHRLANPDKHDGNRGHGTPAMDARLLRSVTGVCGSLDRTHRLSGWTS